MANLKEKIRKLNDEFRRELFYPHPTSEFMLTPMVAALTIPDLFSLLYKVQRFEDFDEDNDPHEEHDFGRVFHKGEAYFWKIDYYDNDLTNLSPDPSNPKLTHRVLTVMHASEY